MTWLLVTIIAYFLLAIAAVVDKTLLKKGAIPNPFVYTFYIAILGGVLMVLLLPFGILWPGISQFWVAMAAGGTFTVGLWLMFAALRKEEASRLTPMIGGLTPIVVVLLATSFLGEILFHNQIIALIFIIIGTFLISLEFDQKKGALVWLKQKITFQRQYELPRVRRTLMFALPAAIFFGLSWVLTKDVYNHQPFISGFFWIRLGALIIGLIPLLWPKVRQAAFKKQRADQNNSKTKYRFLFGQACGGAGTILTQIAVSIASVSIVQALQGVQYVFIFIIVFLSTYLTPRFLKEKLSSQIIIQKLIAIVLIGLGLYLII